jgi:hypothetical protein
MTLQELLKANGMTDEGILAVEKGMKENKLFIAGEENLDIRYGKLKGDYDVLSGKHTEAEKRIAELMQSTAGNETLQTELAAEKAQREAIQQELERTKIESAVKVALLEEKANDIDYMTFKLKEKGELSLDENGKIKGWDDMISGLKTQFPQQFESAGKKKVEVNKLPDDNDGNRVAITKNEFLKKPYAERDTFQRENPEAYKAIMQS